MSIGRDEIEKLVNEQFSHMGIEEFERTWIRYQYQRRFNELFPEYAPTAWASLLELVPLAIKIVKEPSEEATARLEKRIEKKIQVWAKQFDNPRSKPPFSAKAVWFLATARMTLTVAAFAKYFGGAGPTSLVALANTGIHVDEQGNGQPYIDTAFPVLSANVMVRLGPGVEVWDQAIESAVQFRSRVLAEYTQRLDEQIAQVDTLISPNAITVDDRDVILLISHCFEGVTGYALNAKYFPGTANRKTVRDDIRKVQAILFS